MIDDITCSLIADPVPGCGSSESNGQLMDLIVSDITAHVHRIGPVADTMTRAASRRVTETLPPV